jgi:hypothetical protein
MAFTNYFSSLLRRRVEGAPTMEEAMQDYQRMVELQNSVLQFGE